VKTSSTINIDKDQETPGTNLPTVSLKMFVEQGEERFPVYSQKTTVENFRNILRLCGFCQGDVTSITQDAPTRLTITATYSGRKKTPEKSGVL
jgi:hypothetical protein